MLLFSHSCRTACFTRHSMHCLSINSHPHLFEVVTPSGRLQVSEPPVLLYGTARATCCCAAIPTPVVLELPPRELPSAVQYRRHARSSSSPRLVFAASCVSQPFLIKSTLAHASVRPQACAPTHALRLQWISVLRRAVVSECTLLSGCLCCCFCLLLLLLASAAAAASCCCCCCCCLLLLLRRRRRLGLLRRLLLRLFACLPSAQQPPRVTRASAVEHHTSC